MDMDEREKSEGEGKRKGQRELVADSTSNAAQCVCTCMQREVYMRKTRQFVTERERDLPATKAPYPFSLSQPSRRFPSPSPLFIPTLCTPILQQGQHGLAHRTRLPS